MSPGPTPVASTRRIVCIPVPRFSMMSLVGLAEPLRIANYLSSTPLYEVTYHAAEPGPVPASNGMTVSASALPEKVAQADLVIVVGSWGSEHHEDRALMSWLRRQNRLGATLCAVEMGAYILARAGLLEGRRATVHWSYLPGFQERFPDVLGCEQLFTLDGRVMTAAGSTGAIDLMLHVLRQDHGEALTAEVAENMMHHELRNDTTPQRRSRGRGLDGLHPPVAAAIRLMDDHIAEPLKVPEIARHVGLSQRQLERQFHSAMGCSVVQFNLLMRLQHARVLLISTELSVREIATASGFNSLSHFAFAFRNRFDRRPSEYRLAWPDHKDAPSWPGTLATYLDSLRRDRA